MRLRNCRIEIAIAKRMECESSLYETGGTISRLIVQHSRYSTNWCLWWMLVPLWTLNRGSSTYIVQSLRRLEKGRRRSDVAPIQRRRFDELLRQRRFIFCCLLSFWESVSYHRCDGCGENRRNYLKTKTENNIKYFKTTKKLCMYVFLFCNLRKERQLLFIPTHSSYCLLFRLLLLTKDCTISDRTSLLRHIPPSAGGWIKWSKG